MSVSVREEIVITQEEPGYDFEHFQRGVSIHMTPQRAQLLLDALQDVFAQFGNVIIDHMDNDQYETLDELREQLTAVKK